MSGKLYVFCQQKGMVKTGINLYIDGERHHLMPQEEPYLFELEAGKHKLKFKDPAGLAKKAAGGYIAVGGTILGAAAGAFKSGIEGCNKPLTNMANGVRSGLKTGKSMNEKVFGKSASLKGEYELEIHENEVIKLLCTKDKKDGIVMGTI